MDTGVHPDQEGGTCSTDGNRTGITSACIIPARTRARTVITLLSMYIILISTAPLGAHNPRHSSDSRPVQGIFISAQLGELGRAIAIN